MDSDEPVHESTPLLSKSPPKGNGFRILFWARAVTCVTSIAEGYCLGSFAGALVLLGEELHLSRSEEAAAISVTYFALACAMPFGGWISDAVGRVPALACSYVFLIVGALLMASAQGFSCLLLGRIVESVGIGFGMSIVTTYLSEIAPASHRGMFPSLEDPFLVLGVLLGMVLDHALLDVEHNWRWMLGSGCVLPSLALPCFFFVAESPRYLMMRGQEDEALAILNEVADPAEVEQVVRSWADKEKSSATWTEILCTTDPIWYKSLSAALIVALQQMLSGIVVLIMVMPKLFSEYMDESTALKMSIIVMSVRFVHGLIMCLFVIQAVGRVPLLKISSIGVAVSLAFHGLCWLFDFGVKSKMYSILVLVIFFQTGLGPVTWVYIGEVLDTPIRSKGVSLVLCVARIVAGCLLMTFTHISADDRRGAFFLVLAAMNIPGIFLFWSRVPETQGVVLEAVEEKAFFENRIPNSRHTVGPHQAARLGLVQKTQRTRLFQSVA